MSFDLHIPIDDISEADLEQDLRTAARLSRPHNQPVGAANAPLWDRRPESHLSYNAYPAPFAAAASGGFPTQGGHQNDWSISPVGGGGKDPQGFGYGIERVAAASGGGQNQVYRGGASKQYSNLDLALARNKIQESRDKLYQDQMESDILSDTQASSPPKVTESSEGNVEEVTAFQKESKHDQGSGETKSAEDVSKKNKFVNSLKEEHQEKLISDFTLTPPPKNDLMDLMSDLKSIQDENDDRGDSKKTAIQDFEEEKKIKKYKGVKLKDIDDEEEESRPYEKEKPEQNEAQLAKEATISDGDIASEEGRKAVIEGAGAKIYDDETPTEKNTAAKGKHRKKGKHHKKNKQGLGTGPKLDNAAVDVAVSTANRRNPNLTTTFHLKDSGKDIVDLPLTGDDGAWTHKIHGHRDIVAAGAIVMCLGLVVILVSLIALVRRRLMKSTRRRRGNMNNNRKYRNLGSVSETEILRKPKSQRSLFPLGSSEDDDDDDDDNSSSTDEEIIYHQRRVNRSF